VTGLWWDDDPAPARPRHRARSPLARWLAALVVAVTVVVVAVVVAAALSRRAAPPAPAPQLRPCVTEDDSGPCRWDARVQGNGRGRSFTVTPGPHGPVRVYDDDGRGVL